jgi:hypothetical protein
MKKCTPKYCRSLVLIQHLLYSSSPANMPLFRGGASTRDPSQSQTAPIKRQTLNRLTPLEQKASHNHQSLHRQHESREG